MAYNAARLLVNAGALVGTLELQQGIIITSAAMAGHHDFAARYPFHHTGVPGQHYRPRVNRCFVLHAGTYQRRLCFQQRNSLALHVSSHQRPGTVVVFQEWYQRRRDTHDLLRRHVHIFHKFGRNDADGIPIPHRYPGVNESAIFVHWLIGLGDHVVVFFVGCKVVDLVSNNTVFHPAVGRFNEAVLIDAGISAERADQADVRPFRSLNGAHPAVVRVMDVPDLEPSPIAG